MSDSRGTPPPIAAHGLRDGEHGDASPHVNDGHEEPTHPRPPARKDPMIVGKPSQAEGDRETIEEDLRIQEARERKQKRQRD